jgi:hypothetical protein
MNSTTPTADHSIPSPEEMHSALFAYLVMQQSNMASMLLGKTPHPETGKTMRDLDSAKLFIDQLEMLEVKTKGNLSPEEARMLKQNLMTLRLAFVEAANAPDAPEPGAEPKQATPEPAQPAPEAAKSAPETPAPEDEEHRKKFSKKY